MNKPLKIKDNFIFTLFAGGLKIDKFILWSYEIVQLSLLLLLLKLSLF